MKTFGLSLLLASLATANPVELVKRAAAPSDVCFVAQTKGSVCAKSGSLKTPKVIRTVNVATADDCVSAVHVAPRALSGAFIQTDSNVNKCVLYSATLTNQGYSTANGSPFTVYFDKACLQCRPCALGFKNGGFELGTLKNWGVSGNGTFAISKPGYKSNNAASSSLVQISEDRNDVLQQYSYLSQVFEVCKGTNYNITAYVRGIHATTVPEASAYGVTLGIDNDQGANDPRVALSQGSFSGQFQQISFLYTPTIKSAELVFISSLAESRAASASWNVTVDSITIVPA